jgi:signal transduction histidine kinase
MTNLETQIHHLEEKLAKSEEDLKRIQAQLIQQDKLAALGQLTAGIAHEIKNPLNFVNNFAEVIVDLVSELREVLDAGEDPKAILNDMDQNARRISEHGRRAAEIVRSVMQHASSSQGARENTDLNALVSEHLALSYRSRQAHMPDLAVKIEQTLRGRVGRVDLVPQDIGRVIMNLVDNAMDALQVFAPSQGRSYKPVIRVSTTPRDAHVEIRVSDNGPGIPDDIKERIFEPFFTTKPGGSGTGLGLSLCYEIVTQGHGGTLTVESVVGQGATFVVRLPNS